MKAKKPVKKHTCNTCEQIKEWQKDPQFIRAAYEFVRMHTGHSPH